MATYAVEVLVEDPNPGLGQVIADAVSNGLHEYAGGPEVKLLEVYSRGKLVGSEKA